MDDADKMVRRLVDEREIVAVALRYCRALDTSDWRLLDDVFTPDAVCRLGHPDEIVGLEALKARMQAVLGRLDSSHHMVGNHEVELAGDTATHRCYVQAQHVRRDAADGSKLLFMVAGRYEDRLRRTARGWRISDRTLTVMWSEGDQAALKRSD